MTRTIGGGGGKGKRREKGEGRERGKGGESTGCDQVSPPPEVEATADLSQHTTYYYEKRRRREKEEEGERGEREGQGLRGVLWFFFCLGGKKKMEKRVTDASSPPIVLVPSSFSFSLPLFLSRLT